MALSQQVSNTLQALANRPGVESTLILSRKDGSIIKVTGSLDEPRSESLGNGTITPPSDGSPTRAHAERTAGPSAEDAGAGGGVVTLEHNNAEARPTRAEKLAADIFRFVSVASSLSSSVHSAASSKGSSGAYTNGNGYRSVQDDTSSERGAQEATEPNEVQLLRMRSKKHEIIIFPDPKFLCCVVTNTKRPSP
jgi:hypothetical protein